MIKFLNNPFEIHRVLDQFDLVSPEAVYFVKADISRSEIHQLCATDLGTQEWNETRETLNGLVVHDENGDLVYLDPVTEALLTQKLGL